MRSGDGFRAALEAPARSTEELRGEWRPRLYDPTRADDRRELEGLLASGAALFVHDTLLEQLAELEQSREPARKLSPAEVEARVAAHLGGRSPIEHGTWVFYPWSKRLVHALPVDQHRELRSDRNRYKLTAAEQERLRGARIGVIGLSVGNMATVTCALEGIGTTFRLADFDRLGLSNLNRLRSSLHEVGVDKTTLAARELYEIDPYLDITLYPTGVDDTNMDSFLREGGKLDVLIEECDDLYVKVMVRERARALGIPVVMDTSDRGLLDVERFDLEPERPILHGLVGRVDPASLRGLETKDKVPFFLAIVDAERMSARMAASLPEIKQSISSWPQLASSVALGGALAAHVARRIVLGETCESGRFYVDLDAIVRDGAGTLTAAVDPPPPEPPVPESLVDPVLPPRPMVLGETSLEAIRFVAAHGALAPSAHNTQPWKLRWRLDRQELELVHDPAHALPAFDFANNATWVAFGAMLENIELAAGAVGLEASVRNFPAGAPDDEVVAAVRFSPCTARDEALVPFISRRVTNRRREPQPLPLEADALDAMRSAAEGRAARLQLRADPAALLELAELTGAADRITLLNQEIHRDFFSGFRWSREEVLTTRDGLDLATLELTASERAGLSILRQWRVMGEHVRVGAPGAALSDVTRESVQAAAAIGVVSVSGTDREAHLRGGRAMQRMWLTAASRGIAIQPMTSLPYYLARLERGGADLFSERHRAELGALAERFGRLFDRRTDRAEVLLFRAFRASAPTARSLRRPLDEILQVL